MTNRTLQLLFSILLVSQLTGCFTIRSYFDELHYSRKIENRAEKIWGESKGAYRHVEHHLEDFGRGFVAGYESTAKGGDGCPPVLPPTRYWRTKYSNDVGKNTLLPGSMATSTGPPQPREITQPTGGVCLPPRKSTRTAETMWSTIRKTLRIRIRNRLNSRPSGFHWS